MMNEKQEKTFEDSTSWMMGVVNTQRRFLSLEDFWTAYPYKETGLNKEGFTALYEELIKAFKLIHNIR